MNRGEDNRLDQLLDSAVEEILRDEPSQSTVRAAGERVRGKLRARLETNEGSAPRVIRGCGDFRAMIPDYLEHRLPRARALLLEDHSRSCIGCRRALIAAREGRPTSMASVAPASIAGAAAAAPSSSMPASAMDDSSAFGGTGATFWMVRAAAVLAVIGVALTTWFLVDGSGPRSTARVAALEGQLLRLEGDAYLELGTDAEVPFGDVVRSSRDSGAVLELPDGSRVEMAARSEIELDRRSGGTVVRLRQGNVIVAAAPQGSGRLYVDSEDALVTVRGTVFSVNRGTKGSRISVVEGQVQVDTVGGSQTLAPGQQVSTHPSIGPVSVAEEIAWSRDAGAYRELLAELDLLRREVHDALSGSDLRRSTELLDLMPGETVIYGALPNVAVDLRQAYRRIQDRVQESPALEAFWRESFGGPDETFEEALDHFADLGELLGLEVAFAVVSGAPSQGDAQTNAGAGSSGSTDETATAADGDESLVLVARNVGGRRALNNFLEDEIARFDGASGALRLIEDLDALASEPAVEGEDRDNLLIWVGESVVVASDSAALLAETARRAEERSTSSFIDTPFHERLTGAYRDGINYLVGANLGWIMARTGEAGEHTDLAVLETIGILDVRYLLLEREPSLMDERVHHRVELSFDGPRRGLAGWLAAPAPMGSLEFVSPDARLVTAALVKEPVDLVEDLLDLLETVVPDIRSSIEEMEAEQGLSLVDDIAAPLGGEFTFALDGPLLPEPAWKLVLEVYDPARLQLLLEAMVDRFNSTMPEAAGRLILKRQGSLQGQAQWRLESTYGKVGLSYVYSGGYLVAGPNRTVLRSALQFRDSGYHLVRSETFSSLLPQDRQANFSGIVYQNLGDILGSFADAIGSLANDEVTDAQRVALDELSLRHGPTLACAYGEQDRIVFVSNSQSNALFGLLGAGSLVSGDLLGKLIDQAVVEPSTAADTAAEAGE